MRIRVDQNFAVNPLSFENEPDWLCDFVGQPGVKFTRASLDKVRAGTTDFSVPWLAALWDSVGTVGQAPMSMLGYMARRHSLPPVNLTGFPVKDLTDYIGLPFCQKYFMVPFDLTGPLLSVAVLEPSVIGGFESEREVIFGQYKRREGDEMVVPFLPCLTHYWTVPPPVFHGYLTQVQRLRKAA
jgi:hypothetical protein